MRELHWPESKMSYEDEDMTKATGVVDILTNNNS